MTALCLETRRTAVICRVLRMHHLPPGPIKRTPVYSQQPGPGRAVYVRVFGPLIARTADACARAPAIRNPKSLPARIRRAPIEI